MKNLKRHIIRAFVAGVSLCHRIITETGHRGNRNLNIFKIFIGVGTFFLLIPFAGFAQPELPVAGTEAVIEKAQQTRTVRVIARISPKAVPEGVALAGKALEGAQSTLKGYMANEGVERAEAIAGLPLIVLEVDGEQLQALLDSGQIDAIYEDKIEQAYLAQSVPLIDAPQAWALGARGAGQFIAILDTGVDTAHPFFGGRVVSEACYSTNSTTFGATTVCPNGLTEQIGPGAGIPCAISACDHGTHVAGIAASSDATLSGVAPEAEIIAIQVFTLFTDQVAGPQTCADRFIASPCILTFTSDQIRGLQRVIDLAASLDIAAVNMSLGGGKFLVACDTTDSRTAVIDQLRALGIATVIASGNDAFSDAVGAPACISSAVTVGSTTKSDTVSVGFSNSADMVDLLAPGSSITSSILGGGTGPKSGTSMATPHVAGAFAVLWSGAPAATTVDDIEAALKATGKSITDPRNGLVKPRIDVGDALLALGGGGPPPTLTLTLEHPNKRLRKNKTMGVTATVTQAGTPVAGATVNFSTPDPALLTVSPPSAITDAMGVAQATLRGKTRSRTTTSVTAEVDGTSVQDTKPVKVPDLSAMGFLFMLLGLAALFMASGRRRND